jgi:hypothetical protein
VSTALVPERGKKTPQEWRAHHYPWLFAFPPNQLLFKLVAFNSNRRGKIASWTFIDVLVGRLVWQ